MSQCSLNWVSFGFFSSSLCDRGGEEVSLVFFIGKYFSGCLIIGLGFDIYFGLTLDFDLACW